MKTKAFFAVTLFALAGLWGAQDAVAKDGFQVLVCYPNGGAVKAKQAKPAMEKMLKVLESLGGWSQGSFHHEFTSKVDKCRELMAQKKPAFAIASLGLFLEHRQAHHLIPLVIPKVAGQTTEIYRVLVKKGAYKDLGGLKGKTLGGSLLAETRFLHKVVFEGQTDPESHFQLKKSRRALRALRNLKKGKLDAVLVNSQQYRALQSLPFAKDLEPVFTSKPLPQVGLTADEKQTSAKDRKRLAEALGNMCQHEDGKQVCEMFGLESFTPADPKTYNGVIGLWTKK